MIHTLHFSNKSQIDVFCLGPQGGIYCRTCSKQLYEMVIQNPFYPKSAVETTTILASSKTDSDGCRRCRGIVYDAEKMSMRSGVYHRLCFNCAACRRALDYLLAVDSPSEIETSLSIFDYMYLSNWSGLLNIICIVIFQVWFVLYQNLYSI